MFAIFALVVVAIVVMAIIGAALHALFSPWLLLVALGLLGFVWFRRHSRAH